MPTGVALRDARQQLFAAAERVLLRDGANALTSRSVTAEAGCAKGVLHRHFADFDAFLTELVLDRVEMIEREGEALRGSAGSGEIADRVTDALTELFGSVAVAIVGLVTARDALRTRLREATGGTGVPLLTQAATALAAYLTAERELGRLAPDSDVDTLALTLIGSGHLLFAGRDGGPPPRAEVERVVAGALGGAVRRPA